MNTCYYKVLVLQIGHLETIIFDEKHYGTLADAERAAADYKEQGFIAILFRMWQDNMVVPV